MQEITRTEFVRSYARRSNLPDAWAELGIIDVGGRTMIALPCGCSSEDCEGWAMLSASAVLDHLAFHAPGELRDAYNTAVRAP